MRCPAGHPDHPESRFPLSFPAGKKHRHRRGNDKEIKQQKQQRQKRIEKKAVEQGIKHYQQRQQVKLKAPLVQKLAEGVAGKGRRRKKRQQDKQAFQYKIRTEVFFSLCKITHCFRLFFFVVFKACLHIICF